jgi:hypothetical protein
MEEEDYLNSNDVIILIAENFDEKVFHILDQSCDVKILHEIINAIKDEDEHKKQEFMIIKKHGIYELFTYPVIGSGDDAHFGG